MATNMRGAERRIGVGRFSVEMDVSNRYDELRARDGVIREEEVRRTHLSGVVDTGAARLVLPESVARALGFPETGRTTVRYADGRRDEKTVVGDVQLEIQGRRGVFSAVVEPITATRDMASHSASLNSRPFSISKLRIGK